MKRISILIIAVLSFIAQALGQGSAAYVPSAEVQCSQEQFQADRFGIFIHWGIYSLFGQGEWYLNYGPLQSEYKKAAQAFYPHNFDAAKWAEAFRQSGAKYVCFTSRHHDGFSMWHTAQSDYNIVDATPLRRDVLKELSQALQDQGLSLHLYYSHIDWGRPDYPRGRTGLKTGFGPEGYDWPHYYKFMNDQLTELLTQYGPVRCIWFDGLWDHDKDSIPFDWQLPGQYEMIHRLQPSCMVANNHHLAPLPGEDMQLFERDVPGENKAGLSGQEVSHLPLETCQTMNGMWGYKMIDTNYKSSTELIRLLVRTAGKDANLLLNIGPQPDGSLPDMALERLHDMGEWLQANGATIYGTRGSDFPEQPWGTCTRRDGKVYVHIINPEAAGEIAVPVHGKVKAAKEFATGQSVKFKKCAEGVTLSVGQIPDVPDHIIELTID